MKEIVEALKKRISENKNSMLVTVVAGRGSIPRKAGAYMVVGEDGRVTGTIGGGNLEYQATLVGQKLLAEKKNYLHEYNLGQEKSAELGMACGGNATVLFYFVDVREDAVWIRQMEEAEKKKRSILDPDAVRGRKNKNTARVSDFCASVCDRTRWSTFLCRTVFL